MFESMLQRYELQPAQRFQHQRHIRGAGATEPKVNALTVRNFVEVSLLAVIGCYGDRENFK